jgi:phosphocarrier protein FPr
MEDKGLGAEAAIFEAHIELMEDPELAESVRERVAAGVTAVRAWSTAIEERAAIVAALPDPLLAARADDLRDVGKRVLRLMLGLQQKTLANVSQPVIIIARELTPSETATFDPQRVVGFCITTGGPTAHIAILARALGLPAVVAADEAIFRIPEGTLAIVDGNEGFLLPNPTPSLLNKATIFQQRWLEQRRASLAQAAQPAVTADGHRVEVTANIGSVADAVEALQQGADGVGLLRTEFLFLQRSTAPAEDEQFAVYRDIAETMQQRPVIVRTLDIGGDKPLAYISMKPEMNPFLGERGIRLCLNRPELFRDQLRAILRAAPHGNLRIMFPMIADISEVRRARALIDELCRELSVPPVQIGIMVEVPSAALMADVIAPEVDFFSIGTNDLTQYTLAVDRGHPSLAAMSDGLHPAVLRLIAHTIDSAHKFGKRADLCGELGSDPLAVPILLGLGLDEFSVTAPAVPLVKAQIRSLRLADAQPLAQKALACATPQEVRQLVRAFSG